MQYSHFFIKEGRIKLFTRNFSRRFRFPRRNIVLENRKLNPVLIKKRYK